MRLGWMAVVLAPVLASASGPGGRLDGEVVGAKGRVLVMRVGAGREVVQVEPTTELRGLTSLDELAPGERVRVRWSRTTAGARLADVLDADPAWALADPLRAIAPAEAVQRVFAAPGEPAGLVAIDVRARERWSAAHLPGARALPLERLAVELPRAVPDRATALVVYGEGPRDARAPEALRVAAALGYGNARVLSGGFSAWWREGHPASIEPAALVRAVAARERYVVVDARGAERAATGTVPGAVAMTPDTLDAENLVGPRWLPPVVVLGEDDADRAPFTLAERLRNRRAAGERPTEGPPLLLAGGLAGWKAAGGKLGAPASAFPSFVDPTAGEIPYDEFLAHWRAEGRDGVLLLDVRPAASVPFARHVPLDRLVAEAATLPKDREIVVFCSMGKRSRLAWELLRKSGVHARYLRGSPPG